MNSIHPELKKAGFVIGHMELSALMLRKDSTYPWFYLIPAPIGVLDIYQLRESDQQQLLRESSLLAETLSKLYRADAIHISAMSGEIPQLHLHHVVRRVDDPDWPNPVWMSSHKPHPMDFPELVEVSSKLRDSLGSAINTSI